MMSLGQNLAKIRTDRCGFIPYVVKDDNLYFLMAKDSVHGDLTDMGGGVKKTEFALNGGAREFKEESIEIFEEKTYTDLNNLSNCISLINKELTMAILFIPVHEKWLLEAPKTFAQKRMRAKKKCEKEISELIWMSSKDFESQIFGKKTNFWSKIRLFLQSTYSSEIEKALRMVYPSQYS